MINKGNVGQRLAAGYALLGTTDDSEARPLSSNRRKYESKELPEGTYRIISLSEQHLKPSYQGSGKFRLFNLPAIAEMALKHNYLNPESILGYALPDHCRKKRGGLSH